MLIQCIPATNSLLTILANIDALLPAKEQKATAELVMQIATSLEDNLTGPSSSLNVDQHVSATVKGKSCSSAQPFQRKHTVTQTQSHGQGYSLGNAGISGVQHDPSEL